MHKPFCLDAAFEGGRKTRRSLSIIAGVSVGYTYAKPPIMDNQRKDVAAIKAFVEQAVCKVARVARAGLAAATAARRAILNHQGRLLGADDVADFVCVPDRARGRSCMLHGSRPCHIRSCSDSFVTLNDRPERHHHNRKLRRQRQPDKGPVPMGPALPKWDTAYDAFRRMHRCHQCARRLLPGRGFVPLVSAGPEQGISSPPLRTPRDWRRRRRFNMTRRRDMSRCVGPRAAMTRLFTYNALDKMVSCQTSTNINSPLHDGLHR